MRIAEPFVALFTIDRYGRRFLLLIGVSGLVLIYTVLGVLYHLHLQGKPMLVLVLAAIACYVCHVVGAGNVGGHCGDISQPHTEQCHVRCHHRAVDSVLPVDVYVPIAPRSA
jgi:MFS family permease